MMFLKKLYHYSQLNIFLLLLGMVAVLLLIYVCLFSANRASAVGPDNSRIILQVEDVTTEFLIKGTLMPKHRQTVAAPFDSLILELQVTDGTRVESGDLLARLDTAKIDAELRSAEVALLNAEDKVAQLAAWHDSQDVVAARKAVQSAKRLMERSEEALVVTKSLFEQGIIPRNELNVGQRELTDYRSELETLEQQYQKLLLDGGGLQKRIARLELENARRQFEELSKLRVQAEIRAPRSGIVEFVRETSFNQPAEDGRSPLLVGDKVTAGKALFTVQSADELSFRAQVDEIKAARLFENQAGAIISEAYPDWQAEARITHVASRAYVAKGDAFAMPKVAIEADLISQGEEGRVSFRPGGEVFFSLPIEIGRDLLLLPPEALHFSENSVYVMARSGDGGFSARHVEIGPNYLGKTQILSGLQAGDEVLIPEQDLP